MTSGVEISKSQPDRDDVDGTRRVRAVDRTVCLMSTLAEAGREGARLTELANAAGLSEATALRYLTSLREAGWVEHAEMTASYTIGVAFTLLADRAFGPHDVRMTAGPYMEALRAEFQETVNLASVVEGRVVLIEALEGLRPLRRGARVGETDHFHASALGKAILGFMPVGARDQLIGRLTLEQLTDRTLTSRDALYADLEDVRARGYAVDDEEGTVGLRCVAAPIFARDGTVLAAVSVSAATSSFPSDAVPKVGERLVRDAQSISASLGYLPPDEAQSASNHDQGDIDEP